MDTQLRDELKRELRVLIKPFSKSRKKPPFTAEEMVVIAIVLHPSSRPTQGMVQRFIMQKFGFYTNLALACTPFAWRPFWNPTKGCGHGMLNFQRECELVYRKYDMPISMTTDEEHDNEPPWNRYSISTAAARIFLKDRLPQKIKSGQAQEPFPFMRLPPELRNRVYNMVLQLPKSGVCVKVRSQGLVTRVPSAVTNRIPAELFVMKDEHIDFGHLDQDHMYAAYEDDLSDDEDWDEAPEQVQICGPASKHLALLQVNKQIFEEAMPLFYSINKFIFPRATELYWFLKATPPSRREHIEHIGFHYVPSDEHCANTTFKTLKSIPHLRKLEIVVEEEYWKAMTKGRTPMPKWPDLLKMPGIFTLRSIRGLEVVKFHGGSGVFDALILEMTREKKITRAPRKRKAKADPGNVEAHEGNVSREVDEAEAGPSTKKAKGSIKAIDDTKNEGHEVDAAPPKKRARKSTTA